MEIPFLSNFESRDYLAGTISISLRIKVVGVNSLGPGVEIQHQAMAQDRQSNGAYIGEIDMKTAIENGPGLGSQDQVLRCARAGAIGQELVDPRLCLAGDSAGRRWPGRRHSAPRHRRPARRERPAGAGPLRPASSTGRTSGSRLAVVLLTIATSSSGLG